MSWRAPIYRAYERRLARSLPADRMPAHVGVILDGHRRFARAEGLANYSESYRTGMRKLRELLGWSAQLHLPAVTAWVLSTDNLRRPPAELEPYYDVLVELLEDLPSLAHSLGCSVRVIGSIDLLPARLVEAVERAEREAKGGEERWQFRLALGYGGRDEIVDACRSLVSELVDAGTPPAELAARIDVASISAHLYSADLPDPDLVIRTSGEARLSGFLLWQAAYAECVFVDPYWPAFRRVDFLRALRDFGRRERRFGQ
ncbi:MAG TPA: polyprenyl diphosphate synthase [Acidimicrobiales bacterium]|nr:polyprenyl diphosphate synthase [Acidimicrobiales bacterium]